MIRLAPADIGVNRIGHFGFFRPEFVDTLWQQWLLPELDGAPSPDGVSRSQHCGEPAWSDGAVTRRSAVGSRRRRTIGVRNGTPKGSRPRLAGSPSRHRASSHWSAAQFGARTRFPPWMCPIQWANG